MWRFKVGRSVLALDNVESAVRGQCPKMDMVTVTSGPPDPNVTTHRQSNSNDEEVKKFERKASEWWDSKGMFKPLHSMNLLRVELIRNGFMNNGQITGSIDTSSPLKGLSILDIGCGGGILSQPLARLGATVIGIDAGADNIQMANHNLPEKLRPNLQFVCSSLEDFSVSSTTQKFDGVVGSEVIEHVDDPKLFLQLASSFVKPSGSIFVTTINRTWLAWVMAIVGAEYLLGILARGTHDWNKFVSPEEIQQELKRNNCTTRLIHGMSYNPLSDSWSWTRSTAVSFGLHAVKNRSAD